MKKILSFTLIAVTSLLLLQSCKSYKNVPYFKKNISDSAYMYSEGKFIPSEPYKDVRIQPDDILQVTIYTIDAGISGSSSLSTQMDMATNPSSTLASTSANQNIAGYLVDKEGNIELPLAGKVMVAGLSTSDAKEAIKKKALQFYKEPVVNVRLANFKVSVLGEVLRPGNYLVASEKATILDALALSGDMTIYGKRENVLLIRREGDKQKMVRFDLNSADLIQSPYYYLRHGDVVYVEPGKGKAAATDASMVRTYGIIASTLSLLVVVSSRLIN